MTKNTRDRRLHCFEALQIALATEHAMHMPTTPEIERQVDSLYTAGRKKMARLRAGQAARPAIVVARGTLPDQRAAIRPEILAMNRAEVIARLTALSDRDPLLPIRRSSFETLSDLDLCQLLETATRFAAGRGASD